MKNTKRCHDFFIIKGWIEKCENYPQVKGMEACVHLQSSGWSEEDRKSLLRIYENRCAQLSLEPEYLKNSIESYQHQKLSK